MITSYVFLIITGAMDLDVDDSMEEDEGYELGWSDRFMFYNAISLTHIAICDYYV